MPKHQISAGPFLFSITDDEGLKSSLADMIDRFREYEHNAAPRAKAEHEQAAINVGFKLQPLMVQIIDELAFKLRVTRSQLVRAMIYDAFERHLTLNPAAIGRRIEEQELPFHPQTESKGAA